MSIKKKYQELYSLFQQEQPKSERPLKLESLLKKDKRFQDLKEILNNTQTITLQYSNEKILSSSNDKLRFVLNEEELNKNEKRRLKFESFKDMKMDNLYEGMGNYDKEKEKIIINKHNEDNEKRNFNFTFQKEKLRSPIEKSICKNSICKKDRNDIYDISYKRAHEKGGFRMNSSYKNINTNNIYHILDLTTKANVKKSPSPIKLITSSRKFDERKYKNIKTMNDIVQKTKRREINQSDFLMCLDKVNDHYNRSINNFDGRYIISNYSEYRKKL